MRCGWGGRGPSGARTQGRRLGGAKSSPEDKAPRRPSPASRRCTHFAQGLTEKQEWHDRTRVRSRAHSLIVPPLRLFNAGLRALCAGLHHLQYKVEGFLRPSAEWFDHEIDVHWQWVAKQRSLFLERGVLNTLAMRPGAEVLELCCGDGFNSHRFYAGRAARVLAVDYNAGALRHARRYHPGRTSSTAGATCAANFPEGSSDNIVYRTRRFTTSPSPRRPQSSPPPARSRCRPAGSPSGYTVIEPHAEYAFTRMRFSSSEELAELLGACSLTSPCTRPPTRCGAISTSSPRSAREALPVRARREPRTPERTCRAAPSPQPTSTACPQPSAPSLLARTAARKSSQRAAYGAIASTRRSSSTHPRLGLPAPVQCDRDPQAYPPVDQPLCGGQHTSCVPVERVVGGQVDRLATPHGRALKTEQRHRLGAAAHDREPAGQHVVLLGVEAVVGGDEDLWRDPQRRELGEPVVEQRLGGRRPEPAELAVGGGASESACGGRGRAERRSPNPRAAARGALARHPRAASSGSAPDRASRDSRAAARRPGTAPRPPP